MLFHLSIKVIILAGDPFQWQLNPYEGTDQEKLTYPCLACSPCPLPWSSSQQPLMSSPKLQSPAPPWGLPLSKLNSTSMLNSNRSGLALNIFLRNPPPKSKLDLPAIHNRHAVILLNILTACVILNMCLFCKWFYHQPVRPMMTATFFCLLRLYN